MTLRTAGPPDLLEAFGRYETALMTDDVETMNRLFADLPTTLRGDSGGLLVGHREISEFRRSRGGAPPRELDEIHVQMVSDDAALIVAVTAPTGGGRGLQTQLWRRRGNAWCIEAAHVSAPPTTFDPSIWTVVGGPLISSTFSGPLAKMTFAVEEGFAVCGFTNEVGSTAGASSSETAHAYVIDKLIGAGADLRGITRVSLPGPKAAGPSPINAIVPAGLPGSAAATAIALGAATLGIVRATASSTLLPALLQNLWGVRLTSSGTRNRGLPAGTSITDSVGLLARNPSSVLTALKSLLSERADVDRKSPETFIGDLNDNASTTRERWLNALDVLESASLSPNPGLAGNVRGPHAAVVEGARREIEAALGDRVLVTGWHLDGIPKVWSDAGMIENMDRRARSFGVIAALTGRPMVLVPHGATTSATVLVGPRGSDIALVQLGAALNAGEDVA